jgi:hypothetical protein
MMQMYKGFDKDMRCRGFQYEVGREYRESEADICRRGFHACEYPLDVFLYYPPNCSRYAKVELEGVTEQHNGVDTQRCGTRITIVAELNAHDIITAAIEYVSSRADLTHKHKRSMDYQGVASATGEWGKAFATGYRGVAFATGILGAAFATGSWGVASATSIRGAASATGDLGTASATGAQGAASATGYQGMAFATGVQGAAFATGDLGTASAAGEYECAIALGLEGKAKATLGCWITLAECALIDGEWRRVNVQTRKVDGKVIKADVWYQLINGEFVEQA